MLNSNLLRFFRYLEPFQSYKQKKITIFNSVQKVSKKIKLVFYFLDEKYCKLCPMKDKSILLFAAESLDKTLCCCKI